MRDVFYLWHSSRKEKTRQDNTRQDKPQRTGHDCATALLFRGGSLVRVVIGLGWVRLGDRDRDSDRDRI